MVTRGMADAQSRRVKNLIGEANVRKGEAKEVAENLPKIENAFNSLEGERGELKEARLAFRSAFIAEHVVREECRTIVRKTYGQLVALFPNDRVRVENYFPHLGEMADEEPDLLGLAIRNQGRLATFDQGVLSLLPPGDARRECVEIIPATRIDLPGD